MMKPTVIDDLLPDEVADKIEKKLLTAPWIYTQDITFSDKNYNTPAFSHCLYDYKSGWISPLLDDLKPIITAGAEIITDKEIELFFAKALMQLPLNSEFCDIEVDSLHVDQQFDHLVFLYYAVDSDGETIISDLVRDGGMEYHHKIEDHHTVLKVTPKKNRLVIFDGNIYHTAVQPKKNMRCVVNFNINTK